MKNSIFKVFLGIFFLIIASVIIIWSEDFLSWWIRISLILAAIVFLFIGDIFFDVVFEVKQFQLRWQKILIETIYFTFWMHIATAVLFMWKNVEIVFK